MIEHFFGSTQNLILLLLSLAFRIFRSAHDGLSERGNYFYSRLYAHHLFGQVGAWPWHLMNWAGRDIFIAILYFHVYRQGCPWQTLFVATFLNWFLHDLFYWWAVNHRDLFRWDAKWPKFPSLFKDIFSRLYEK